MTDAVPEEDPTLTLQHDAQDEARFRELVRGSSKTCFTQQYFKTLEAHVGRMTASPQGSSEDRITGPVEGRRHRLRVVLYRRARRTTIS